VHVDVFVAAASDGTILVHLEKETATVVLPVRFLFEIPDQAPPRLSIDGRDGRLEFCSRHNTIGRADELWDPDSVLVRPSLGVHPLLDHVLGSFAGVRVVIVFR